MTPTAYVLSLFVLMTYLISTTGCRVEETGKAQSNATATKLENGEASEGFSLSIQVKQTERSQNENERRFLDVGQTVEMLATVLNVSQVELIFVETDREVDFHFTVLDSDGKPVPRTRYGKKILQRREDPRPVSLRVAHKVSPRKSLQYEFNLSRRFDLSLAGTYSAQASCKVFAKDRSDTADLKSNVDSFELR